jgi:hypothetical protein
VNADYYEENRTRIISTVTAYRKDNRESYNAYRRKLRARKEAADLNYRLRRRMHARIANVLKGRRKDVPLLELLGCSIEALRAYLAARFEPGMSWENYGFTTWHIDHVRPLATFDLTNEAQLREACHFSNLRPLWAAENESLGGQLRRRA